MQALWCATSRRQYQLLSTAIHIVGIPVTPAQYVRDLGVYLDADLLIWTHNYKRTVSRCFVALRQLRQVRRLVRAPTTTLQTLVVNLVQFWLDYGNRVLGRNPNLFATLTTVCVTCTIATHIPPETDRPYQSSLRAASPRTHNTRSLCWLIKSCVEALRNNRDHSFASLICQVGVLFRSAGTNQPPCGTTSLTDHGQCRINP